MHIWRNNRLAPRTRGTGRFSGAQDSVTAPLLAPTFITPCLSPLLWRYVLHVQSVAPVLDEPIGPGASPPSYSPTPRELFLAKQPLGPPPSNLSRVVCVLSERLRRVGSDTGTALSSCPRPRIAARYQFERQPWFQPVGIPQRQHALVAQSRPLTGGNGVVGRELQSPFPNRGRCRQSLGLMDTTTRAPLLAAPALLDARGFRGPPPVEMPGGGAV